MRKTNERIETAMAYSLSRLEPKRHWARALYDLARGLKGIAELRAKSADDLRPLVQRWARDAMARDKRILDPGEVLGRWPTIWAGVKRPFVGLAAAKIEAALQFAAANPSQEAIDIAREISRGSRVLPRLISILQTLQDLMAGGPFFLPTRKGAVLLGWGVGSFSAVAALLRFLEQKGVIREVESGREKRATRFVWAWGEPLSEGCVATQRPTTDRPRRPRVISDPAMADWRKKQLARERPGFEELSTEEQEAEAVRVHVEKVAEERAMFARTRRNGGNPYGGRVSARKAL